MVKPTIALSAISGLRERRKYWRNVSHPHSANVPPTGQHQHEPADQHQREHRHFAPARRRPQATHEVSFTWTGCRQTKVKLRTCTAACKHARRASMSNGWGEMSLWTADRMEEGDWTPAIWRSPELAEAASQFASHHQMCTIREHDFSCRSHPPDVGQEKLHPQQYLRK